MNKYEIYKIFQNVREKQVFCEALWVTQYFRLGSIAQLSYSWLVKPSSVELRLALILVITPTTTPTPGESRFEPLLDYLGSCNLAWKLNLTKLVQLAN